MTTITLPRAVVEQALDALKDDQYRLVATSEGHWEYKTDLAIAALERALAQQQANQTWVCPDSPEHRYKKPGHCEDCGKTLVQEQGCEHCNHPLYAATKCRVCGRVTEPAPQQRKPLTEEEIDSIWDNEKAFADIYAIARAIERAHGIVGQSEDENPSFG